MELWQNSVFAVYLEKENFTTFSKSILIIYKQKKTTMSDKSLLQEFTKGIYRENAVTALYLGLCPVLAVTTSLVNGLGMGAAASFVLLFSNLIVAGVKGVVPKKIRIPIFIVIIASLSILIGMIGIINTMTTAVLERKKEIGIMKAIGAKNKDIFWQFFIESGLLGLIGGIVGVVVGLLIGVGGTGMINNLIGAEVALDIDWLLVGITLVGSFLVGGLAGVFPAIKAAKQNPVEALRG